MNTWKFTPEEIVISNRRGFAHTAIKAAQDSWYLSRRGFRHLNETISCLQRVDALETMMAKQEQLQDPALVQEEADQRSQLINVLLKARDAFAHLLRSKFEYLEHLEREMTALLNSPVKHTPTAPAVKALKVSDEPPPPKPEPLTVASGLKLDPELMDKMREELLNRGKEPD